MDNICMGKARRHHYVPVHILQNFSDDRGNVHCYDKVEKKIYKSAPQNLCSERDFHTIADDDYIFDYENWITQLEESYISTLKKVTSENSLENISYDEFAILCTMVAFQYVRTRGHREFQRDFQERLHARVSEIASGMKAKFEEDTPTENSLSKDTIRSIQQLVPDLTAHLLEKNVFLMDVEESSQFWIGDNPVVMHNDNNYKPYGNMGFGVAGIQIYLPLSPKVTLCFWCPAVLGALAKQADIECKAKLKDFLKPGPPQHKAATKNAMKIAVEHKKKIRNMVENVIKKRRLPSSIENVGFMNSLQLSNAHRFVMSASKQFVELDDMLKYNPKLALPPNNLVI